MSKEMVISANPHETRVAIMEEGQLCEFYVEREKEFALVGSIYKGRVTRVLPGMQSAFVEIGLDGDAFLYVSDFLEDIEEFDHIVTTAEDKIHKMEDQGGQAFASGAAGVPALEPTDVDSGIPASAPNFSADAPASSGFVEHDAPEHVAPPQTFSPPPIARTAPPMSAPAPGRGRFDNRGRGGRDFGNRGRSRGGRPGRHGSGGSGGRGGDRRYGRELPQSKYASPRPFEEQSSEPSAPGESHISIILPGESLAKYKERPPVAPGESQIATESLPTTHEHTAPEASASTTLHESPSESTHAPHFESRFSAPPILGPLPGESISKWKTQAPPSEEHHESPAPSASHAQHETQESAHVDDAQSERDHFEARDSHDTHDAHEAHNQHAAHDEHESHSARTSVEDHGTTELTEEEATALAEHIAEAQSDEAARHAEERAFSAEGVGTVHHDEAEEAVDSGEPDSEESENHETEDAEIAEAEAEAESEGMIAPPDESGTGHDGSDHVNAIAASGEQDSSAPSENPPMQNAQPWKAQVRNDSRSRMQHPARRGGRDRGRRDDRGRRPQHGQSGSHGSHRPQAPRRTQLIADLLKQGQEIIVQIAKEPLGKKGARITSHVALPGRFLVYMPTLDHTGVSRKISSAEDRARLRHLVNDAKGASGGGFIVRTAAGAATAEEVRADVEFLTKTWSEIKARSEQRKAPSLLHRDLNLVERILRDYITPDFGAIWVDTEEEYTKVVDFMSRFQPQMVGRVKLYTKETPVFEEFGIQQEIDKGLRPKVWLKSGGYIVINHTEALVAIDVNTGKFVGKGSNRLEDTIVRTNLEACKEIVRQMRLRDLGGIIVIDFIDMEDRRNREKVMATLEDALRADRAPSKMLRFNEFGLIAITRKRTKQALERTLCQPCPYCTGSGMVKSIPTLCYEIQCEARKMAPEMDSGSLTLRVHPEIAKALKTRESSLIEELERWTKKSVIIQADPTLHWEQYDIY
jgi:Rne/Rng family ribonuclease